MRLPPRWVIAVSLATGAAILGDSLLYAVLPVIWADLGLEASMVGLLLGANRFVRLASNPVAGWVISRSGVRVPFILAVFVAALTTALYASGLGLFVLLAARVLWGICWSFLRLGGYLAALDSATDGNRGYYLGFFNGVTRFGSLIAVVIGAFLTDTIGFETTIAIFTVLSLIGALAVLRERPPAISEDRAAARVASSPAPPTTPSLNGLSRSTVQALGTVFGTVFLQGLLINGLVTATLGYWLAENFGSEVDVFSLTIGAATLTGALLGVRFLSASVWAPMAGHFSDRLGRLRFFTVAGSIQVVALLALAASPHLLLLTLSSVALFLASASIQISLDATAGDLSPVKSRPRIMSWYATSNDLGSAIGPVMGYLIGTGIGLDRLYAAGAILFGLVCVAFLLRLRTHELFRSHDVAQASKA